MLNAPKALYNPRLNRTPAKCQKPGTQVETSTTRTLSLSH